MELNELENEVENLKKMANSKPEGITDELQKKFNELEDMHNEIKNIKKIIIEAEKELERYNHYLKKKREEYNKLSAEIEAREQQGEIGVLIEMEPFLSAIGRRIDEYSEDISAALDSINNSIKILNDKTEYERQFRKEIEDILSKPHIDTINVIDGSSKKIWKEKYLKYKAKYLKLKSL